MPDVRTQRVPYTNHPAQAHVKVGDVLPCKLHNLERIVDAADAFVPVDE